MKRTLIITPVLMLTCAVVGVCVQTLNESHPAVAGVTSDPEVAAILGRSCQDCHSDKTVWPWYSHIPPIGSALKRDVTEGREQVNFSRWPQYSVEDKERLLTEIVVIVRNKQMPPGKYTFLHPSARLSDDDIRRLSAWAQSERHKLKASE